MIEIKHYLLRLSKSLALNVRNHDLDWQVCQHIPRMAVQAIIGDQTVNLIQPGNLEIGNNTPFRMINQNRPHALGALQHLAN